MVLKVPPKSENNQKKAQKPCKKVVSSKPTASSAASTTEKKLVGKNTQLFGVRPFSNDTVKNLYINTSVSTLVCKNAQKYLGAQEVTASQFRILTEKDRKLTQYDLIGQDDYYLNSSWCALSMDTLMKESGYNIIDPKIDKVEKNGKGLGVYSTVDEFVAWGNDRKTYHTIGNTSSKDRPKLIKNQMASMHEGDFIIWKNNKRSHIGLIESVNPMTGEVVVLEGNANSNGRNRRDGFIRKIYSSQELARNGYSGYIDNTKLKRKK